MCSRHLLTYALTLALWLAVPAVPAVAQTATTADIGAQVSVLRLDEFDTTAVGGGVQASWSLTPWLALDGMISIFPGGGDDGNVVEEQRKVLGLIGVRAGQSFGPLELYARARPGFLNFAEKDRVACVLIVPPPLSCRVAEGYTAFATELGAGARIRLDADDRWRVNLDLGDLMVRYAPDGEFRRDKDFGEIKSSMLTHNLVFNAGLSWRF